MLKRPDELGRYVVWDLTEGSYDRHLERLHAERSANDPPPLTPERLRSLVEAITGDDPVEQRWARYELEDAMPEPTWEDDAGVDEALSTRSGPKSAARVTPLRRDFTVGESTLARCRRNPPTRAPQLAASLPGDTGPAAWPGPGATP